MAGVGSSARSPNRRRRCEGDAVRGRSRVGERRARGAGAVAGLRCCCCCCGGADAGGREWAVMSSKPVELLLVLA